MAADPSVSPAGALRRRAESVGSHPGYTDKTPGEWLNEAKTLARDVLELLAVGERDKAEKEQMHAHIAGLHDLNDELLAQVERDRRQIEQLTERLTDAQQLLARFEFLRHGSGSRRPMDGEGLEHFACPVCGWPQGGHTGPGRYKGNAENTHEEGCSLYAALHGEPAPRLLNCHDRPARAVLADKEDAE